MPWIDKDNRFVGSGTAIEAVMEVPSAPPTGKGGDYYWDGSQWVFDGKATRERLENQIIVLRKDLDAATAEDLTTAAARIKAELDAARADLEKIS